MRKRFVPFACMRPFAGILAFAAALPALSQAAPAQDFYVKQPTVGCFSIGAARRLSDPRDARRSDPVWLKSAMKDGNCRQVQKDEDWKVVTHVEDFSLMRHDVPGADPSFLFFRSSDLVDWHGQSPGTKAPPPPPPAALGDAAPRPSTSASPLRPAGGGQRSPFGNR